MAKKKSSGSKPRRRKKRRCDIEEFFLEPGNQPTLTVEVHIRLDDVTGVNPGHLRQVLSDNVKETVEDTLRKSGCAIDHVYAATYHGDNSSVQLSFEPHAIRQHFDTAQDMPDGINLGDITDQELWLAAYHAQDDDILYGRFHEMCCNIVEDAAHLTT